MFFYIGDDCPVKSMKQVEPRLFLDGGWNQKNGIWYKGYSTDCVLEDSIYDIVNGYQPSGKYCVICNSEIYHPILRGFPIYLVGSNKTNLKLDGYEIQLYETLEEPNAEPVLSLDEASIIIGDILVENTKNLLKYNEVTDLTTLVTAGLDTITVWAILDHVTKEYNLSLYIPTVEDLTSSRAFNGTRRSYDSDLMSKVSDDYWGYYHACFYENTNWNITGYYAETYTYRDAEAINAIANYYGKKLHTFPKETDYLYWFLQRPNTVEAYKDSDKKFDSVADLKSFLWSTIWYDHQMWHLDNNLNFSPFADIRIPQIAHRLSLEDLASNCVSGQLQRNIIARFRPDLLNLLSDYKNAQDVWGNFRENFTESMIDPKTKLIYR
jgi:hypothetical protein